MAGQILQRDKRVFIVRVFLGRSGGKRKYLNKTVHGSKKVAENTLTALLRERDLGTLVEPTHDQPMDLITNRLGAWSTVVFGRPQGAQTVGLARHSSISGFPPASADEHGLPPLWLQVGYKALAVIKPAWPFLRRIYSVPAPLRSTANAAAASGATNTEI
jgi:hypothetical protein